MSKKKSKLPAESRNRRAQSVPVIRGNVWEPLSRLRDEFDGMFDETPGNTFGSRLIQKFYDSADPVVELGDKKHEFQCVAEIPA